MPHLVLGLGVLVVLVSALADVLRIGGEPGFGYKQGVGVVVGIALIIAGPWWGVRRWSLAGAGGRGVRRTCVRRASTTQRQKTWTRSSPSSVSRPEQRRTSRQRSPAISPF